MVADSAANDLGLNEGVGHERLVEGGGGARRRLDRQHPPCRTDPAGERQCPFAEIGADVDRNPTGAQKGEHRRMDCRRMQQCVPAARVERVRHIDEIAVAVEGKTAGPFPLQPRQQTLFAPAPHQASAGRLWLAGRA